MESDNIKIGNLIHDKESVYCINGFGHDVIKCIEKYLINKCDIISIGYNEYYDLDEFKKNNFKYENHKINAADDNYNFFIKLSDCDENLKKNHTVVMIDCRYNLDRKKLHKLICEMNTFRSDHNISDDLKLRFLMIADFNYIEEFDKFDHDNFSWPFTRGKNHFYTSEIKLDKYDRDIFLNAYSITNPNAWDVIFQYTRGYIFDIHFLSKRCKNLNTIKSSEIETHKDYYSNSSMVSLPKIIKDNNSSNIINSISTEDKVIQDCIDRSSLFNKVKDESNLSIYKPKNYLSEYCINYYLANVFNVNFPIYPSEPYIENEIIEKVTYIEMSIKNELQLISKNNNNIIDYVSIYENFNLYKSNTKDKNINQFDEKPFILNIRCPRTLRMDKKVIFEEEWSKQQNIKLEYERFLADDFNFITLGELSFIMSPLKNIYYLNEKKLNKNNINSEIFEIYSFFEKYALFKSEEIELKNLPIKINGVKHNLNFNCKRNSINDISNDLNTSFPANESTKEEIKNWLKENNIQFNSNAKKSELFKILNENGNIYKSFYIYIIQDEKKNNLNYIISLYEKNKTLYSKIYIFSNEINEINEIYIYLSKFNQLTHDIHKFNDKKDCINMIRLYRNAFSHHQKLSPTAIETLDNYLSKYLKDIAHKC